MGGMCPKSHPHAFFHIGAEFGFYTGILDIVDSSTLVFANGDTTGFGGHGDFIQGWTDLPALGKSFDNCNGFGDGCAWNSFGTPDKKMGTKSNLDPEVLPIAEQLGQNGPLDDLPGNNPVGDNVGRKGTTTKALASMVSVTKASVTKASSTFSRTAINVVPTSTMITIYVTRVVTQSITPTGCGLA